MDGKINLVLLAGVVIIVFLQGLLMKKFPGGPGSALRKEVWPLLLVLSLVLTPMQAT